MTNRLVPPFPRLAVLALLGLGCTGTIGEGGDSRDRHAQDPSGPSGTAGPAAGSSVVACADPSTPNAASTSMRRLTQIEYNHTVRDLLGDTSGPADDFPPDESFGGFESNNATPVTQIAVETYGTAAETLATRAKLTDLAPCDAKATSEQACARTFITTFGQRAYRRPLEPGEVDRLLQVFTEKRARSDFDSAIRLVLQAFLQAPAFLYRVELTPATGDKVVPLAPFELATRLSYLLWSTMPDDALLAKATADALASPSQLEAEARRMLADPRANDADDSFYRQWLKLSRLDAIAKDPILYPQFTPALKGSMKEETARFVRDLFGGTDRSLATLLTAPYSFVDSSLSSLYGVPAPASGFAKVTMPSAQRSGILTQAGLLSATSFPDQPSPIHRGKFVRQNLLCQTIPDPPKGLAIIPPKVDLSLSSKQRFQQHESEAFCKSCHTLMDPIGFGFGHYDAIGRWQDREGNAAVDATGEITEAGDADGTFDGAMELGQRLARSSEVHNCMAREWLRFALGRTERDEDVCSIASITSAFTASKLDLRELVVAVVKSDAFRYRRSEP